MSDVQISITRQTVGTDRGDDAEQLDWIVARAAAMVGAAGGGLHLIEPTTGSLVVQAAFGTVDDLRGRVIPTGCGLGHQIVATRQALVVDDCASLAAPEPLLEPTVVGSAIGTPVFAGEEVLGALVLVGGAGGAVFSEADLPLIQVAAELAAVALDNIRIVRDEQRCRATARSDPRRDGRDHPRA